VNGPKRADAGSFLDFQVLHGAQDGKLVLVLKGEFNGRDFLGLAMLEVGDIAGFDLSVFTV